MGLFEKMFGTHSDRELKLIYPIIDKIEKLSENEVSKQEEIKNPQKNEEPITRKEIVEIVETRAIVGMI